MCGCCLENGKNRAGLSLPARGDVRIRGKWSELCPFYGRYKGLLGNQVAALTFRMYH